MKFDQRIIAFIGQHEGFVNRWYKDPVGVPTIGYGFTWGSKIFRQWWLKKHGRKFRAGDKISKADALMLLSLIIKNEYAPHVDRALGKKQLAPNHASASVDMVYNCGPGALKWRWFKALLANNPKMSAKLFAKTATTARGRRLPGLVRRRREGSEILSRNVWPRWIKSKHGGLEQVQSQPWEIAPEDFLQGMEWLNQLGFYKQPAEHATLNNREAIAAVLAFQKQHKQLTNDGILGRATIDQIQRVIDLQNKAKKTAQSGSLAGGAGAIDYAADASGFGGILLAIAAIGLIGFGAWLAWSYRDELKLAFTKWSKQ